MKKFFAWVFLLPMAIYWMIFVWFNWEMPEEIKNPTFHDRFMIATVKQGIMFLAGVHLYFWHKWK